MKQQTATFFGRTKFLQKGKRHAFLVDHRHVYYLTALPTRQEYESMDLLGRYAVNTRPGSSAKHPKIYNRAGRSYQARVMRKADPKTFTVVSPHWTADKDRVYAHGKYKKQIDRNSLTHIQYINTIHDYVKDKNAVYDSNLFFTLKNVDAKTFNAVHKYWAKDKYGFFCLWDRKRHPEIDADSFVIKKNGNACDQFRTYTIHRDGSTKVAKI